MFGIGLIIIGVVVLLEAFGVISGVSAGMVWGVVFIFIGISLIVRRAQRRERRTRWMAERRERKDDPEGSN